MVRKKDNKHLLFSDVLSSYLEFVHHSETNDYITNLFLPPTADGARHKGNALPKPVVWSKDKPGKQTKITTS